MIGHKFKADILAKASGWKELDLFNVLGRIEKERGFIHHVWGEEVTYEFTPKILTEVFNQSVGRIDAHIRIVQEYHKISFIMSV